MRRLAFVLALVALGAGAWWASASTRHEETPKPRGGNAPASPRVPVADPNVSARITQILLVYRAPGPGATATRSRAEARALADEILGKLRAGEPMEPLVARYTDDRRADGTVFNDGTQSIARNGATMPALERAIFELKPGELVREPIDTGRAILVFRRDE